MKKRIRLAICAAAAMCLLTACGGSKSSEVTVDVSQLRSDLQGTITSGSVAEVSSDIIASTYFLDMDQIEDSSAALNSGASACEVCVIKCKDSAYTSDAEELFRNYVKNRSELFASYAADEVPKLDSAIIESAGNYTVLCVTDDTDAAQKILDEAGF